MKDIGIGNVRTDFDTYADSGEFDRHLKIYDMTVSRCRDNEISILPIITAHKAYKHWLDDVSAIKKRMPDIPCWEIINEPDVQFASTGYPDCEQYSRMLKSASALLRADDKTKVLTGGFGLTGEAYFKSFIKNVDKRSFNFLNFHVYTGRGNLPESVINTFKALQSDMSECGANHPVWLTETGYSTVGYGFGQEDFLNDIVPSALARLHMKLDDMTVGVISDFKKGYQVPADCLDEDLYKHIRYVSLDEIASLNTADVQMLIPTIDESFPMQYVDALVSYLKKGGTIVLSGGAPFFYDYLLDENSGSKVAVGDRFYRNFHIGVQFPWTIRAKLKAVPEDSRYLTGENLKGKDELIPLKTEGGIMAGIYHLNSDLKGNLIVNSDISEKGISYRAQAERLPRMFLIAFSYGCEKVFWYHLRSFEYNLNDYESHFGILHKDFKPKPAFYTYSTLVKMCPSHSTRPTLNMSDNGLYICNWRIPDGRYVTAVWTTGPVRELEVYSKSVVKIVDAYGNSLPSTLVNASSSIIYIISKGKISVN